MDKLMVGYTKKSGETVYEQTTQNDLMEKLKNSNLPYKFTGEKYEVLGTDGAIIELEVYTVH